MVALMIFSCGISAKGNAEEWPNFSLFAFGERFF
jgi:hypothetical protein